MPSVNATLPLANMSPRPRGKAVAPHVPARSSWALAALLVLAICAVYSNSLHGPFIFDDDPSIVENQTIRDLGSLDVLAPPPDAVATAGRPVVNLSLAINYAIGGLSVEGYHVVNLVLHVLAALVLFALLRETLRLPSLAARFGAAASELALAVALLWAIHPLQTESVTYVVQRAEVMAGLFYFATLYCFLRSATAARGTVWSAAAVGTCALGMASKEVMVSAPLMALLFDRTLLAGSFRESLRRRFRLWLALAGTMVLLALLLQMSKNRGDSVGFGLGVTAWEYARTQFGCIIHYLRLVCWPNPLTLDYGRPIAHEAAEIVPYALGVSALVAATGAALFWRPEVGLLGAWFFAILAPTSSIVPLLGQTKAEHRMYLPLAGLVVLLVLIAYRTVLRYGPGASHTLPVLLLAPAVLLGWRTYQRNKDYQSELAIWEDTIRNCPRNERAYLTRGTLHWTNGRLDAALQDYDRCILLSSRYAEAYLGRGNVYLDKRRYDEALRDYEYALVLKPTLAEAHHGRGTVLGYRGQGDAAMKEFDRAIELKPGFAKAHYDRANLLYAMGDFDAAVEGYDRVIRLRADYADAYNSRGNAHDNKGQVNAAIADYDRAIALRPDFAEAYSNRCSARDVRGESDAAIKDCDQAIALRPDFAEAYSNRGNALQSKGQYLAAIKDYDKAIELKPNDPSAYQNRAMAHCRSRAYDQAWADIRTIQKLGATPIPTFLKELSTKSGRSD